MAELNTYAHEIKIARDMLVGEDTGRVGTPYYESENVLIVPFENGQKVAVQTIKFVSLD